MNEETAALLSVIIPVANAEATVRQAVESVLAQPFEDMEVVVVDDASTDRSADRIASLVADDSRVRLVALDVAVGPGWARNAGIEAASGRYVLFLDADDWLEPGALTNVAQCLEQTDVDVLMVGRVDESPKGKGSAVSDAVFADAPSGAFALAEYPEVLAEAGVAWNKVCRRTFLDRAEIRFPPGTSEGLPFGVSALLLAEHVAVLRTVTHHSRRPTTVSVTTTAGTPQFDRLEQWERVFAFLDEHPDVSRWRSMLFDMMAGELAVLLRAMDGLAVPANRRFFDAAVALAARVRPAEHVPPSGRAGATQQALVEGDFAAFEGPTTTPQRTARAAPSARRVGRVASEASSLLGRLVRRLVYALYRRRALSDDLVVFASNSRTGAGGDPLYIHKELDRLAPGRFRSVWLTPEEPGVPLPPDVTPVDPWSLRGLQALATARFVVYDDLLPLQFVKRRGQTIVQTMQHVPLKTEGVDLHRYPAIPRRGFNQVLAESDRWDVVLSPGQHASEVWQRAYPSDFRLVETGSPHTDGLINDAEATRRRARAALGVADDAVVALYAPTARDYLRESELRVPLERLSRSLPQGFVLAVRQPPAAVWDHAVAALAQRGHGVDASGLSTVEACLAADLLITDFSSIMFDFACLDRPIVVIADDIDTFTRVRGLYLDLVAEGPGEVVRTAEELAQLLSSEGHDSAEARARRTRFRERFCGLADGAASQRAVREVFLGADADVAAWPTAPPANAALESA